MTACILLMVFFHLKKLLGRFQKDPWLHIVGGIFVLSQEHRLHGKGPPRVPQLSFTSQSGFLLLPPPGTPTDKRQIKPAGRPPRGGLPLPRADGVPAEKLEWEGNPSASRRRR